MSTLKTNNVQVGQSVTATNNFTLYQPSTPDGTVRIGVGNSGATTSDVVVIGSSGITKGVISSGTAVTASGTSVDFTGIPSTAKRITVMFSGVSTNGSSQMQVQIGAGSIETSSYIGAAWISNTGNTANSTGFLLTASQDATEIWSGSAILHNVGSNIWVISGSLGRSTPSSTSTVFGGSKTLSGVLDRLRITTVGGTNTFDAGSINILYEG